MNRRKFLTLTGTFTSGSLLLPSFLHAFANQTQNLFDNSCIIFVQLNGGNDGLNTLIPYNDPLYYHYRPNIAIPKNDIITINNQLGFHPALKELAQIQQNGHLAIVQNVGYNNPVRSHFRSQEIWQTAPTKQEYLNNGWLGRFLDHHTHNPTSAINLDQMDNLALIGQNTNALTIKDPAKFLKNKTDNNFALSKNPSLDFVRKIANSVTQGADQIQKALQIGQKSQTTYPNSTLAKNLEWIVKLIKGNLNSKIYYTSINGFDTHDNQLNSHKNQLAELSQAIYACYQDLQNANLLQQTTIVLFSEFGRRVKDNGKGTDHGTAAPMFIIGGQNKGTIIGNTPDLQNLDQGDLIHQIDFRSVYATLLEQKFQFDPKKIGINNPTISDIF